MRTESRPVSRFAGRRIHFIGIGGCGMSGLARMLLDAGALVSGSDPRPNAQTRELAELGATIWPNQDGSLLTPDIDLVVRTAAVGGGNAEYQAAVALGLPQVKYAQLIGQVMQERFGVAVSGTHGKSTVTSMIAYALLACGKDPSFVIGGTVRQLGGSSRSGSGPAFVVEACEFDRSFHNYGPRLAVITNIEADHLDCYPGGLPEIIQSFRVFAERVTPGGSVIANGQDPNVRQALEHLPTPVEWISLGDSGESGWSTHPGELVDGCHQGQVWRHGRHVADLRLRVAGRHNLYNATVALAACQACGLEAADAARALGGFQGVDRRMTELGRCNGAIIVDDYGHHPTEINTTLRALREKYSPQRLICVFQPHQHSRTRLLMDDFAVSFTDADQTILPDIYASRDTEADRHGVGSAQLATRLRDNGREVVHLPSFPEVIDHLRQTIRPGDLVVTMGAGNICDVGRQLIDG